MLLLFLLTVIQSSLFSAAGVFTVWNDRFPALAETPTTSLPATGQTLHLSRSVDLHHSEGTEEYQDDYKVHRLGQKFDFNKQSPSLDPSQTYEEPGLVRRRVDEGLQHLPPHLQLDQIDSVPAGNERVEVVRGGEDEEVFTVWKKINDKPPATREQYLGGARTEETPRRNTPAHDIHDDYDDYLADHFNNDFDFYKETSEEDVQTEERIETVTAETGMEGEQKRNYDSFPKTEYEEYYKESPHQAARKRLKVGHSKVGEKRKHNAPIRKTDPRKALNVPEDKYNYIDQNYKVESPSSRRKGVRVGGSLMRNAHQNPLSEETGNNRRRDDAWAADDEYNDLVKLVENLNNKFSKFQKIINISDQEVDSTEGLTTTEKVFVTPGSGKRRYQTETTPAKPQVMIKRRKVKPLQNSLMKATSSQQPRHFVEDPRMPKFPHFPHTKSGPSQSRKIIRSRVGDLPRAAYDNKKEFHLYF